MAAEDYTDFGDYGEDSHDPHLRTQRSPSNMYKAIPHLPFHGEPWTGAQEERLESLWRKRHSLDSMSQYMGRTKIAIVARLEKLGLDPEYANESVRPTTNITITNNLTKKEPMMQNFQHLLALLQKNYTTVAVKFDTQPGSEHAKQYTYKVPLSMADGLDKGDLLVVPARNFFTVVSVVEVHDSPQIDVKNPLALKWAVQKVDRTAYDDQTAREEQAIKQVEVAERRRAQEEALQTLLGTAEDREAFLALINAPK